jgi:hypothetical protein
MLELNEPNKLKWTIEYHTGKESIISGRYFDFIPKKQELVILNDKIYSVTMVAYDFDACVIRIEVNYLNDLYSKNTDFTKLTHSLND